MIFETLRNNTSPTVEADSRFGWYPRAEGRGVTQEEKDRSATYNWIRSNLPFTEQSLWEDVLHNSCKYTPASILCKINQHDTAELVELLYPRFPHLFHTAYEHTLSPSLLANCCEAPFSPEILQSCVQSRTAQLNAACLFALTGATACLEKLLELGADPNGLDTPESWSYIKLANGKILPVNPMDCALLTDNEDCQLALELYGGKTLRENLPD